jgi:hypothetical protein
MFVSLPALLKTENFRFPGCFYASGVFAEIIPVEPDQGNACAGKVVPLFAYASLSQHFSQTIFSTHVQQLK